jgi:hypothetical protein
MQELLRDGDFDLPKRPGRGYEIGVGSDAEKNDDTRWLLSGKGSVCSIGEATKTIERFPGPLNPRRDGIRRGVVQGQICCLKSEAPDLFDDFLLYKDSG